MSAKDYVIVEGCFGTPYLCKKKKGNGVDPTDKRVISDSEIIGLFKNYLKRFCVETESSDISTTENGNVIFSVKLEGDFLEEIVSEIKENREDKIAHESDFAFSSINNFDSSVVGDGKSRTVSAFFRDLHKHFLIEYAQALSHRLCSDTQKEVYFNMCDKSFDFALFALKFGLPIRRDCWDANFAFMQIPAEIDNKDVKNMKSIPEEVKCCIENSYKGIQYKSQCIFYNTENSLATYWVPTIDDIMANDWEIVENF